MTEALTLNSICGPTVDGAVDTSRRCVALDVRTYTISNLFILNAKKVEKNIYTLTMRFIT